MVFQHGALFPHSPPATSPSGDPRRRRASASTSSGLRPRGSLSARAVGGERQRVALARALAADPEVDPARRARSPRSTPACASRCAQEVAHDPARGRASALLVTHDQAEALSLATRHRASCARPRAADRHAEEVYERPRTRWVAEFLGDADVLPGAAAGGVVECELGPLPRERRPRGRVDVVLRPESVTIAHRSGRAGTEARVTDRAFFGTTSSSTSSCPAG
jgi:iron(III) transport system ATP-binding protein